jgi:peptide methionine sulfoxide reductase MsrB
MLFKKSNVKNTTPSKEEEEEGTSSSDVTTTIVVGDENIMSEKAHGTSSTPVQNNLKWNADRDLSDRICNFNRHGAEQYGYWTKKSTFLTSNEADAMLQGEEVTFLDSNTGKPLFIAPRGRTAEEFIKESKARGWPSFRDGEVVWENVRILKNGEAVSVDGTHLGHNLPDKRNRYCINLVSVAGR